MNSEQLFIISSDLFGGYKVKVILNNCSTINDILNNVYDDLKNCLLTNHLYILADKLDQSHFYIKDLTFEQIIEYNDVIFVYEN